MSLRNFARYSRTMAYLFSTITSFSAFGAVSLPPTGGFVPKEILVVNKACQSSVESIEQAPNNNTPSSLYGHTHGLIYNNTSISCLQKFTYATESEFQQALVDLPNNPEFEYVGVNKFMKAHGRTNDTYSNGNSAMNRGYDDLWNLKISRAPQAWDISTGANVVVAVIDSGVDFSHPDAPESFVNPAEIPNNNIDDDDNGFIDDVSGWDFVRNKNTSAFDEAGHGTHVAGIIAAKGNNALGIVGVAYGAKVLSLRVLDKDNNGTEENVARAIVYAAKVGARVINISLGGTGDSPIIHKAIQNAKKLGAILIDSSGNDNADASNVFPARYPETITVSSVENDGKTISSFSNHGEAVDLVAGGGGDTSVGTDSVKDINILSLLSSSIVENVSAGFLVHGTASSANTDYILKAGTSMAAPVVAGVAALVISANPSLTPDQVKAVLTSSAQTIDGGKNATYGYGLVDAYAATSLAATGEIPAVENNDDGGFFGCAVEASISDYSSIVGFLALLMVTLIVLLRKDYPEKRMKDRRERDIESTFL